MVCPDSLPPELTVTLVVGREAFASDRMTAEGEAFHHLFRVRRLRRGDGIRLVDGAGSARRGRVTGIGRKSAEIELMELLPSNEPTLMVEILTAMPRPQRAAWLVEKSTELGVVAIRFLHSERGVRPPTRPGLERLRRVALAAVEQSHRSLVPELSGPHRWQEDGTELLEGVDRGWFLDTGARGRTLVESPKKGRVVLLVGPEGGWVQQERALFRQAGLEPLSLGPRTLRIETAAVAGAALLLSGSAAGAERPEPGV